MSDRRYAVMFLRLGFLASVLFAVFWSAWHLAGYQVPAYTTLKLTENISWIIPISRWWDIPFAFFIVNTYAWIFRIFYKFGLKFVEKNDIVAGFAAGLVVGLITSLAAVLAVNLGAGLITSLVVDLVVGLIAGFAAGLVVGLITSLGV